MPWRLCQFFFYFNHLNEIQENVQGRAISTPAYPGDCVRLHAADNHAAIHGQQRAVNHGGFLTQQEHSRVHHVLFLCKTIGLVR